MFGKAMTGLVATGLLLTAQSAMAGDHDDWKHGKKYRNHDGGYDYARVVDVEPIVRHVRVTTPRRECWMETRHDYEPRYEPQRVGGPPRGAAGSMILGSIIGAAIGNQVGSGDGRRAATVAGAIIGSAIGHDRADRHNGGYYSDSGYREARAYEVERCDVRYDEDYEERIDGYRVTYVYNGREQTTRLPYDPGDRIRVRVNVRPADDC